jgi:hypothetical protein
VTALDKAGLVALAERVETLADESQLVRLLEPVAGLLWKDAYSGWVRFLELANVKAWESAAMTLTVGLPWPVNVTMATAYGSASVMPCDGQSTGIHDKRGGHCGYASTPALALTAAAIRAIAAGRP